MMDDRNEELASLYALDLLEGEELAAFERTMAGDPELRRKVAALRSAAAGLAHLAPKAEPPPLLKTQILASLAGRKEERPASSPSPPSPARILPFPSLIPWAIAACLAVSALATGRLYWMGRSENALIRDEKKLAELDLTALRNSMEEERIVRQRELQDAQRQLADAGRRSSESLQEIARLEREVADARQKFAEACSRADDAGRQIAFLSEKLKSEGDLAQFKIATLASMLGNSPKAIAVAVWNPMEQEGMLKVSKLPMPASDKDYQLWVIDPQYPTPCDGGVVILDPTTGEAHAMFKVHRPIKNIAKFAISLESKGGMPEPTGPIVMLSE